MIAARLAGGNLFFGFLWWRFCGWGFFEHSEQLGALGFFLRGILWGIFGALGAARSTRIFFEGILWGILFFGGVVGCVLD